MKILVVHTEMGKGGAEQVCMSILDYLSKKHKVKLITSGEFELKNINNQFGTNVENVRIDNLNYEGGEIKAMGLNLLNQNYVKDCIKYPDILALWILRKFILLVYVVLGKTGLVKRLPEIISKRSLAKRLTKRKIKSEKKDIIISTGNWELSLDRRVIHYIHYPYSHEALSKNSALVNKINRIVSGYDENKLDKDIVLTNSKWTKKKIEKVYNCKVTVLYPPVRNIEIEKETTFEEREKRFIIAGRLSPDKNILRSIEIIKKVRKLTESKKISLTVVGPKSNQKYEKKVKSVCKKYSWISYEGFVKRKRLKKLYKTSQYGIHGKDDEHFGIVVAEMVSNGMIPFVPNDGGQTEIVKNIRNLVYKSKKDAVKKIAKLVQNKDRQKKVLEELPNIEKEYGKKRFERRIKNIVEKEIQN